MNKKKIALVMGFIILVFILGFALYLVFFKPTSSITPSGDFGPGNLPGIGNGNIT